RTGRTRPLEPFSDEGAMRPSLAAGSLLLLFASAAHGQTIDTLALRAHTYFLAHDRLGGRSTASHGERLAALSIVSELRRMGTEGAGPGGEYLQPVPLRRVRTNDGAAYLALRTDGSSADGPPGAPVGEDVVGYNIAALVPGSDPARRHEVVAFTAHYDHLGIGTPDENGDSIFNGFSDNAAGVAMLLAIADAVRKDPPARSTLFLFFTCEEQGPSRPCPPAPIRPGRGQGAAGDHPPPLRAARPPRAPHRGHHPRRPRATRPAHRLARFRRRPALTGRRRRAHRTGARLDHAT